MIESQNANIKLSGKKAVVTGATRGIGSAIARQLNLLGAHVIGTGTTKSVDITTQSFDEYLQADFTDLESIQKCAKNVQQIEPDILINNAGINKINPFTEISLDEFRLIQQVNVTAPFALCQAAIPAMKIKHWGRIVNISSIWGKVSKEFRTSYSTSKFALDGMTLAIAAEYTENGILANCIAPGFTNTELTRKVLGEEQIEQIKNSIPIKRMANVDEIACFVAWLASPINTYITGQNIAIDGGFTRV
jgi:NAD(P)-dependent dehydrogenase (short-subunit alcohol dehydrogenase family)